LYTRGEGKRVKGIVHVDSIPEERVIYPLLWYTILHEQYPLLFYLLLWYTINMNNTLYSFTLSSGILSYMNNTIVYQRRG
jgi:hypothetical protein